MTYAVIAGSAHVRRIADGAVIPNDPRNVDWQKHQEWLAAGNTPAPLPEPTLQERARTQLQLGLTIKSIGTPTINGTYAATPEAVMRIMTATMYVALFKGKFPGGSDTIEWPDVNGAPVMFSSVPLFFAVAKAVCDFATAIDAVLAGTLSTLPLSAVTLA